MTFIREVREELSRLDGETGGEAAYEIYGALSACGRLLTTRHAVVARRAIALLRRHPSRFGVCDIEKRRDERFGGGSVYVLSIERAPEGLADAPTTEHAAAFVRGAFLARGSVGDPDARCQAAVPMPGEAQAHRLVHAMEALGLDARLSRVHGKWTVYLRKGDSVAELLGLMGASGAYMKMESARVMKEMREGVNRQVNCDSANIAKTQFASERQLNAINAIERAIGLGKLSSSLEELARLRLDHPDASLEELGQAAEPPIQKSGVNNRMRRLLAIANKLAAVEDTTKEEG